MTDTNTEGAARAAANAIADKVGLERTDIRIAETAYVDMLRVEGALLLETHAGRLRFKTNLALADFGIEPHDEKERVAWQKTIGLGFIYTMPENVRQHAERIENAFRNLSRNPRYVMPSHFGTLAMLGETECFTCNAHGFADLTEHYQAAHADVTVPTTDDGALAPTAGRDRGWIFKEWLDRARAFQAEYKELAQYIWDNWDTLMREMAVYYGSLAIGTYERLRKAGRQNMPTEEDFVREFVARRMAAIANRRDEVRDSFYITWQVQKVPLGTQLAEDQKAAETILLEQEEIRAKRTAMLEVERELARSRKEVLQDGMQTLVKDVRAHTNGLLNEVALGVLEAIHKNGEVPGASVKALRNLVENLSRLSLLPDQKLDEQMAEVRGLLNGASLNDNVPEVRTVMKRLAAESAVVLLELNRAPQRSGRHLGVPDTMAGLQTALKMDRRGEQRKLEFSEPLPTVDLSRSGGRSLEIEQPEPGK